MVLPLDRPDSLLGSSKNESPQSRMIYEAPKAKYAINYGSRLPTNPLSGRISSTTVTVLYVLAFVLFVQFLAGALLHKYDVYSAFPFSTLGMNFRDE